MRRPGAAEWQEVFPGDASPEAYRRVFLRHTGLTWEVVQSSQADLLRLVVDIIPAETGAAIVLGLAVLFSGHPKGEQAGQALLATLVMDLPPRQGKTLLAALAAGWVSAGSRALDDRAGAIRASFCQALWRLRAVDGDATVPEALAFLAQLVCEDG
jgi:hypothetical protein